MNSIRTVIALLLAGAPSLVGAQEVVIAPNLNLELIGIVYNTASGYTPEDDGYTLAPDAAFMKPYSMFGERVARHEAVQIMKEMAEQGVMWENELFEIGLCFDEFDFSHQGGAFRPIEKLDLPIVRRFLKAMDDLADEDYIQQYFSWTYPCDFRRIEESSKTILADLHLMAKKIPEFMNEEAVSEFRVIPTLHIEPFVGYGSMMTDTLGRTVAVPMFGLSLDNDDTRTLFGISPRHFAHESLHPFVTRAMNAFEHETEARMLQEIFPMVETEAHATGDYAEWDSYFGETMTRTLENAMNGSQDLREQYTVGEGNFLLVAPAIGILQREFCGSDMAFFDFYPTLVACLIEILKNDENR
jgi:hypothetical protein